MDLDEVVHYQGLRCLQIHLFSPLVVKKLTSFHNCLVPDRNQVGTPRGKSCQGRLRLQGGKVARLTHIVHVSYNCSTICMLCLFYC